MRRRQLIQGTALFAAGALAPGAPPAPALTPPASGAIPVAFVLGEHAVVIDFCGPWEVFQDAGTPRGDAAFSLYTVAETRRPLRASAGLQIVPDFDFASAPPPKVIVIPAQRSSPAAIEFVRRAAAGADVTMSVCTGAFLLAATGLLDGHAATTHHDSFDRFAAGHPRVRLDRGARFVDSGNVATAGGLTSGIDLALHVVERYYGRAAAQQTADYMEYQGRGWQTARR
jgi:transcriptional regulator GlxA family with amidase domain